MKRGIIAKATTTINAPASKVWDALVNPDAIKQYMFGTTVSSDWRKGSAITWSGEWQGKQYEDKGALLRLEPNKVLEYTHFSPLAGLPDKRENYHTVTIELEDRGSHTVVELTQDNNANEDARRHSEQNWAAMLDGLKKFVES